MRTRLSILVLLMAPTTIFAQAAPTPASTQPPSVVAGWQNGFFLQSANGDNRLTLGTIVQVDGRFTTDDPPATTNTFAVRKARLIIGGRVARYFDFKLMPDFGNGTTSVPDAYVDVRFSSRFRVRAGKDKTPFGYEILMGDAALLFPERALPSSLAPNRDVGIQVQGDLADSRLTYAAGVVNGVVDGTSSKADVDTNSGKDLAARVLVFPFRSRRTPSYALGGLGFHLGGSTGVQAGSLPVFSTSVGQQWFSYAAASGGGVPATVAAGRRTRVTPAVVYHHGAFGAFAEYIRSTQTVARGDTSLTVANQGWEVTASYFVTGETSSAGLPTPKASFDPTLGRWGALQVVTRYAELTLDDAIFAAGLATTPSSRRARQFTAGVNWYPNRFVKYYLTYERVGFDPYGAADRPVEHTLLCRVQLAF